MTLRQIANKVMNGIRITDEDALELYQTNDIVALGQLADQVNRKINRDRVFFNVNRHINPTNICVLSCKFCAFSRKPGEEGAYAYNIDEMVQKASEAVAQGATELHMVGGLHPRWNFKHFVDMIRTLHEKFPQVHLKAFTVVELDWMAKKERRPIADLLKDLKEAGLGSLPGGGAEIFHPEVRDQICDTKVTGEQWIETHRTAHKMGLRSNCTMLYGHIENYKHRVDHMRRLRELQDETGGFNVFIPLAFQPFHNDMGISRYTIGIDDLKNIAVARLYLDNFKNIKSYWVMLGQDVAELGLHFGANDLDGTVTEEKISKMAGGRAGMVMTRNNLESLIRRSDRIPVERDTLYRPIANIEEEKPEVSGEVKAVFSQVEDKLKDHILLSKAEWNFLATKTDLFELAQLSKEISEPIQKNFGVTFAKSKVFRDQHEVNSLKDQVTDVSIDLTKMDLNLETLQTFIRSIRDLQPKSVLSLIGMERIFNLANQAGVTFADGVKLIRESGIDVVECSNSGAPIPSADLRGFHLELHKSDVGSVGRIEVKVQNGSVDWENFVERLLEYRTVATDSNGLLGVKIISDRENAVAPSEYLRALALSRLILPPHVHLISPLDSLPTLSPAYGLGVSKLQHPSFKLLSCCVAFGADDFGVIDESNVILDEVLGDLSATDCEIRVRNGRFGEVENIGVKPNVRNQFQAARGESEHVANA